MSSTDDRKGPKKHDSRVLHQSAPQPPCTSAGGAPLWWGPKGNECFSLSIQRLDFEPLSAIPDAQPRCFDLSSITPSNGITTICEWA
ncbi:hypothetical protein BDV34DRAFT_57224 [Aspergillus parasiticus]|uniref:Uncharacterized protein n=1 Tax=Aspergillus parasiticus TaxID=5067 RepID=A0A5N6DT98_ASPPA|nr:hypothetical protein BDV34DRAFT_57224 [Aspergillus parasiticus]